MVWKSDFVSPQQKRYLQKKYNTSVDNVIVKQHNIAKLRLFIKIQKSMCINQKSACNFVYIKTSFMPNPPNAPDFYILF